MPTNSRPVSIVAIGLCATLIVSGCTRRQAPEPTPPPPVAATPEPRTMPTPPMRAAANLVIPPALPDGSYATPNRELSDAARQWHVRAALNVAALQCDVANPAVVADYNRLIKTHAAAFATVHKQVMAEYRAGGGDWQDRFDDAMTRLYNYFAQPPAQAGFCAVALPMLAEAATTPAGRFGAFATTAIAKVDAPFVDFYRAYDRYRTELAAWRSERAGQLAAAAPIPAGAPMSAPRPVTARPVATASPQVRPAGTERTRSAVPVLRVDPAVLVASTDVTVSSSEGAATR